MRGLKFLAVSSLVALVGACASQIKHYGPEYSIYTGKEGESLQAAVVWSKTKEHGIDVLVRVKNRYPYPIVIKNPLLSLEDFKVADYDTTQPIELQPDQYFEKVFIFKMGTGSPGRKGDATLAIRVLKGTLESPAGDLPPITIKFPYQYGVR